MEAISGHYPEAVMAESTATTGGRAESGVQPVDSPFSDRLEGWLKAEGPKTLGGLDHVFAEKSFAVAILLLLFLPALPLPTAGLSHLFEAIAVVIGAQMVLGAKSIWLPERWRHRELGEAMTGKAIPLIARRIRWFERFAKPRGGWLLERRWFISLAGLVLIGFAAAAGFAPPFSGLDTLPALGAVVLCLGLILGDLLIVAIGFAIGVGGVTLILTVGAAAFHFASGIVS